MITDRLLGPSRSGDPGSLTLPWSCAIYSIVNWMVAFLDVEGIQVSHDKEYYLMKISKKNATHADDLLMFALFTDTMHEGTALSPRK